MFKRLFGSSDKPSGTSGSSAPSRQGHPNAAERTVQSIQTLQEKEDMLEKRRELLEKKIATEVDKAKQLSSQNKKPQALMCLKRKKLHEKEVENVNNLLMRILEQRNMLENSRLTAETLASMQNAAQAQKATMQEVKIENVDKVLEDINDVSDEMRTVQEALGAPIGLAAELDDDELLAELDEIAQSELDAELLDPGTVPNTKVSEASQQSLPAVPDTVVNPPAKVSAQDLEIQELEKELGLAS